MGRTQVAAVRRNVARPWELAAHHVVCVITPDSADFDDV
jgi:hypothetical protein